MAKKVVIETDECIGCGSRGELCPDVFELDDEIEKLMSFCRKEDLKNALKKLHFPRAPWNAFTGRPLESSEMRSSLFLAETKRLHGKMGDAFGPLADW